MDEIKRGSKEFWAMSVLSDAQELISMGLKEDAIKKINNAKRILQGKYTVIDNGFSIQIME